MDNVTIYKIGNRIDCDMSIKEWKHAVKSVDALIKLQILDNKGNTFYFWIKKNLYMLPLHAEDLDYVVSDLDEYNGIYKPLLKEEIPSDLTVSEEYKIPEKGTRERTWFNFATLMSRNYWDNKKDMAKFLSKAGNLL